MVKDQPFGPTIVGFYGNPGAGMLISPNAFETAITDPVGAGPARVVEYQDGERWLAEKWDGYWENERVYADELEILIRPDANARWAAFLDGALSYAEPPGGMTSQVAEDLEADGFQVGLGIWQTWMAQWFNLNPAAEGVNMFRDPRLRQALNLSVDRAAINAGGLRRARQGVGLQHQHRELGDSARGQLLQPADFQAAQQLRDAAGFGDDNPVSGVYLGFGTDFHRRTAEPVFNQLLERGWDFEYFDASRSVVLDRFFQAADFVTACLTWESPFDPDVTMAPTVELNLKGWMYGSPRTAPAPAAPSLADFPNDEVLQGLAETEASSTRRRVSPPRTTAWSRTTGSSRASETATPMSRATPGRITGSSIRPASPPKAPRGFRLKPVDAASTGTATRPLDQYLGSGTVTPGGACAAGVTGCPGCGRTESCDRALRETRRGVRVIRAKTDVPLHRHPHPFLARDPVDSSASSRFLLMNLLPGIPPSALAASNRPRSRWPPSANACTSTIADAALLPLAVQRLGKAISG